MIQVSWCLIAGLTAAAHADDRDDDIFGSGRTTVTEDADIDARLAAADKRVTLGGQLYMRGDAHLPDPADVEGEGDNPDAYGPDDVAWASTNLLDLFVDARPNDRVRAYVRGRLRYDPTVVDGDIDALTGETLQQSTVGLDQLWLNFDVARRLFVTAGRQRVKWGAGRFWNPTDFLQPQHLQSLEFFDDRTGVDMVKLHLPVDRVNLYAVADLEGVDSLDTVGGAARAELLVGLTELAASVAAGKDRPLRLGGQVTTGLWLLDLRAEVAVQHGVTAPFVTEGSTLDGFIADAMAGKVDLDDPFASFTESRQDDWIPQVVGGFELGLRLGDEDTLYLGGEYFFNDAGYADPDVYSLLLLTGGFSPLYLGRHYAAVYAWLPGPGRGRPWNDWSYTLSALSNLSDGTGVVRLDTSVVVLTELTVNAYLAGYGGGDGEFHYALEIPATPGFLDDGLDLDAPLLDVGVGATVRF